MKASMKARLQMSSFVVTENGTEAMAVGAEINTCGGMLFDLGETEETGGETPHFPGWKRCFDVILVVLASVIWLPVLAVAMTFVKAVSPGPVFYRQRRVGLGGKPFMIFKLRSMKVNAETQTHQGYLRELMKSNGPMRKLDEAGDSRLIPGGRLFRATGLDELPQIFNVLAGEMSLVGPRPCTPYEFDEYLPDQKRRVLVPPGVTGAWQVSGKNKTTFSQMVELDLRYGESMSMGRDLIILWKTVPTLVTQVIESQRKRNLRQAEARAGLTT